MSLGAVLLVWMLVWLVVALLVCVRLVKRRHWYTAAATPIAGGMVVLAPAVGLALGSADEAPDGLAPYIILGATVAALGVGTWLVAWEADHGAPPLFWFGVVGIVVFWAAGYRCLPDFAVPVGGLAFAASVLAAPLHAARRIFRARAISAAITRSRIGSGVRETGRSHDRW